MEQVPAASDRSRSLTTHELLLLRYDESGRLAALPRLAVPRVTHRCPGDVGSCLDAALRDAGAAAGTHVWLVARQRGMLLEIRGWSESRLDPGEPRDFNHVHVERRRLRP